MPKELYRDRSQPVDVRAKDLLMRMRVDEKLAQLSSVWSRELLEDGKFSKVKAIKFIGNGIGQITRPGGESGLEPKEVAGFVNEIQRFLVKETRLGIPAIMHEECLSGYMTKGATTFPQVIGTASTWDPDPVEKMAQAIRKQMRLLGIHQGLAPVLDVARDPRWGRTEETFGEDPYLIARMGTSYVKGLQGEDIREGVMATIKHFVGYSASEGGLNWASAHIPERELKEVFLFPFECAIKEGNAFAVMNAYHDQDGVPCAASGKLLRDILRKELGFEGIVVSDYDAVVLIKNYHKVAKTKGEAAKLALEAGIDIELPQTDCYGEPLKELVEKGIVSEKLIDEVVFRILKIKFLLSLFENPYIDVEKTKSFYMPEYRKLSLEIARKSIVLLKNDEILPLKRDLRKIAVIGPHANNPRLLLGDYHYPVHIDVMKDMISWELPKEFSQITTVLEGVKKKVTKETEILYEEGCDVTGESKEGFKKAVEIAKKAEVAIVVVGDKSGLTKDCTVGEARDNANLKLPGVQEELVLEVSKTGTPIVFILITGRPYSLKNIIDKVNGIIEAWLPAETGGEAIAEVLFGDYNPGGKLPITFPRSAGQIPVYYYHKVSGGRSQWHEDYVDESVKPLFPFGHGLSYTTFEYSHLRIQPKKVLPAGRVIVKVDVENTGKMTGDEVVELYIKKEFASITRPEKELKGFKRITLNPDEKKTVVFEIPIDVISFYDLDMKLVVESGEYTVEVGTSSQDIKLQGTFEVRGEKRVILGKREYFTKVYIE